MRCVRALLHDRAGLACLLFLGAVLLAALLAPWLAPWDPLAVDGSRKLAPCGPEHWLGTDRLGRDIFSRLLYGARATLGVSLLAMMATVSLGALLGMLAGLVRGRVEACVMRLCDVMLSFPGEVMVLAIVGMLGPGLENVVLACVVAKWPWYARMMRTVTLRYADRDFVRFAQRPGHAGYRRGDPDGLGPVLPGARRAAAHPGMGHDAGRGARGDGPVSVADAAARPGHPAGGGGLQLSGRQPA